MLGRERQALGAAKLYEAKTRRGTRGVRMYIIVDMSKFNKKTTEVSCVLGRESFHKFYEAVGVNDLQ